MDWTALTLSLKLAAWTMLVLLPIGIALGRTLAWKRFAWKPVAEGHARAAARAAAHGPGLSTCS